MLASESDFHKDNSFFYAKIDDHGIRRGDTAQITARWRRPVASRVALDMLCRVMRSAPYRLIRMAIEMTGKAGSCFPVVYFMSCITVAKQPCYGTLKLSQSILLFVTMY